MEAARRRRGSRRWRRTPGLVGNAAESYVSPEQAMASSHLRVGHPRARWGDLPMPIREAAVRRRQPIGARDTRRPGPATPAVGRSVERPRYRRASDGQGPGRPLASPAPPRRRPRGRRVTTSARPPSVPSLALTSAATRTYQQSPDARDHRRGAPKSAAPGLCCPGSSAGTDRGWRALASNRNGDHRKVG